MRTHALVLSPLALSLALSGCAMPWKLADGDGDGYTLAQGDCDDADPAVNPGVDETWYDGVDGNCDGADDFDADGDGFTVDEECDDGDPQVFPSDTPEVWYDCVDDNCDNNDGDQDGDGYVPDDYAAACADWEQINGGRLAGDCWDTPDEVPAGFAPLNGLPALSAAEVFPGAADAPYDGVDAACDGDALEFDVDADGFAAAGWPDRDGVDGDDCDDADAAVRPDAVETCLTEGVDDDCDGSTAGVDAEGCVDFFVDGDGDGFGGEVSECRCEGGDGFTAGSFEDCDDANAAVRPDAVEVCNGLDDDCDGGVDVGAQDAISRFADADGDGYGDPDARAAVCPDEAGWVDDDSDCHDDDASAFPGSTATETPLDGVDTDCDGLDVCTDLDCDGLVDLVFTSYSDGSSTSTDNLLVSNTGNATPYTTSNSARVTELPGQGTRAAAAADLDGDGYLDLIFAHQLDDSGASDRYEIDSVVWWGSASGYGAESLALPSDGASALLVEDLDGDGLLDVVVAGWQKDPSGNGTPNYAARTYVYWGSSLSARSAADVTDFVTPGALAVASGDLDGDGYTDLVFANEQSNNDGYITSSYIYWGGVSNSGFYQGNAAGRTELPTEGANDVAVADLDGDGLLDVIVANRQRSATNFGSSDDNCNTDIYWGDGTRAGFDGATPTALPTLGARELALADLDADGRLDVMVTQFNNGAGPYATSRVFLQPADRSFADPLDLNVPGARRPVAADVDGDGLLDIIWPSEREGTGAGTPRDRSFVFWADATRADRFTDGDRLDLLDVDGGVGVGVADLNGDGLLDLAFAEGYAPNGDAASASTVYRGRSGTPTFNSANSTELDTVNPLTAPLLVGPGLP